MVTNRFPSQAEQIERVKAILNLTDEALAAEVAVRPETMQKYAAGYQKAGDKLMRIISRLPETRAGANAENQGGQGEPSLSDQLATVLRDGTMDEVRLVRQVVQTLHRQVEARWRPTAEVDSSMAPVRHRADSGATLFSRKPRLLPALGYIPAGLPQGGVEQVADQFVMVEEGQHPDADFALKVQGDSMVDAGIHHGDWVLMSTRRAPREGSVVAALIDNETTLKSYVDADSAKPQLRSENSKYPARIIPLDELQVQGVMVGKLQVND